MQLTIQRRPADAGAILGDLFLDGTRVCYTLEREAVAIAPGTYPVRLTASTRAMRGELWTPDRQRYRLPEICDVPGRSGLRLHALNRAAQSSGCPGVGFDEDRLVDGEFELEHARDALVALFSHLLDAEGRHEPVTLTIQKSKGAV